MRTEPAGSHEAVTVLLAGDTEVNRLVIADYLEAHGMTVHHATDSDAAVAMANELLPDLVLIDM